MSCILCPQLALLFGKVMEASVLKVLEAYWRKYVTGKSFEIV